MRMEGTSGAAIAWADGRGNKWMGELQIILKDDRSFSSGFNCLPENINRCWMAGISVWEEISSFNCSTVALSAQKTSNVFSFSKTLSFNFLELSTSSFLWAFIAESITAEVSLIMGSCPKLFNSSTPPSKVYLSISKSFVKIFERKNYQHNVIYIYYPPNIAVLLSRY